MLRQKIQQDAKIISFKVNNLNLELEYIAAPKYSNLASCQLFCTHPVEALNGSMIR